MMWLGGAGAGVRRRRMGDGTMAEERLGASHSAAIRAGRPSGFLCNDIAISHMAIVRSRLYGLTRPPNAIIALKNWHALEKFLF